jgi:hypothetical protein
VGASSLNATLTTKEEAIAFFNQTFIARLGGLFDPKLKRFTVPGFAPSWGLLSLHHVCFKPGVDGMFIGLQDVNNDWSSRITNDNKGIKPEKLYQLIGEKYGFLTFKPVKLNFGPNTDHETASVKLGSTFLLNCVRQNLKSYNPGNFLSNKYLVVKALYLFSFPLCHSSFIDEIRRVVRNVRYSIDEWREKYFQQHEVSFDKAPFRSPLVPAVLITDVVQLDMGESDFRHREKEE